MRISSAVAPSSPVRCTVVAPFSQQRGGAELSLIHALTHADPRSLDLALAVPEAGEMTEIAKQHDRPVTAFGTSRTRDLLGYTHSVRQIAKLVRRHRSDLVLAWEAHPQFRASAAALFTGRPSVWFQKGGVVNNRIGRIQSRLPARAILANSCFTASRQQELIRSVNRDRPIYVVPSGVQLGQFDAARVGTPASCRHRLGLPADRPIIVLVGRLQQWKGFHVLVEALYAVRKRHPTAMVVLVGGEHSTEPDYPARLHRLADELGISASVLVTGFVPHAQVNEYMQAADVVVHASVNEPFGIVVLEAMALGKPLVAANNGGPPTVVEDGVHGLLADPTDAHHLAQQLNRLLGDSALGETLGQNALERAKLFSVEKFVQRLTHSLAAIIDRQHHRGIIIDDALVPRTNDRDSSVDSIEVATLPKQDGAGRRTPEPLGSAPHHD